MATTIILDPPPFFPMPTVVAALEPLAADPLTLSQVCRWLTAVLIFELNDLRINRSELMEFLQGHYNMLLIHLQQETWVDILSVVRAIDPNELYEPISEHILEHLQLEEYSSADAVKMSDSMHEWMKLCVIESCSRSSVELKLALLATLNMPYLDPYTGAFSHTDLDDIRTIERWGFTGGYGSVTHQYCFEEIASAFHALRDATESDRGTRIPDNEEVYHMLRELACMTVNATDAYLALPEVRHGRLPLYTDRDSSFHVCWNTSYECTVRRMLDPETECPAIVKQALKRAGIQDMVGKLLTQAFSDMDLYRRHELAPNPQDFVGFVLYRFVILAALQQNVDFDGQIRAVVDERFDNVWEEIEPEQFPHSYTPFGFPDEMSGLRDLFNDQARTGTEERAEEFEPVDVPIEAIGPRINPLDVATVVSAPDRSEVDGCNICLEDFSNNGEDACLKMACQHLFHESCLDELLNTAYRTPFVPCPLCRHAICPARDYRGVAQ